jgi:hypothetical protein
MNLQPRTPGRLGLEDGRVDAAPVTQGRCFIGAKDKGQIQDRSASPYHSDQPPSHRQALVADEVNHSG